MNWFKRFGITLLILPLAGIVLVGRWVNKLLGKSQNPFQISEAEAQTSCWTPPPSCGGCGTSCSSCSCGTSCSSCS